MTFRAGYGEQQSKKISNDQELIQSDPTSHPQNQKGNNQIHKLTAVYERYLRYFTEWTVLSQTGAIQLPKPNQNMSLTQHANQSTNTDSKNK